MDNNMNNDEGDKPDFEQIKDDPLSVACQFDHWVGWLLGEGYSPLAIQSGMSMAMADFAGFVYDTFEPDDEEDAQ